MPSVGNAAAIRVAQVLFGLAVGHRDRRGVALPFDPIVVLTEVAQRDITRLAGDRVHQRQSIRKFLRHAASSLAGRQLRAKEVVGREPPRRTP